jgi:ketosteroid isomerase-like protein
VSSGNLDLVRRAFANFVETGEPDWELTDDNVETYDHDIMDAGEYRGHAGIERWLGDWSAAWSEFEMEAEEFLESGEHVVVVLRMRAKGRGSNVTVERQDALVHELRDGKIVRLDYYNNREQALASVGISG